MMMMVSGIEHVHTNGGCELKSASDQSGIYC